PPHARARPGGWRPGALSPFQALVPADELGARRAGHLVRRTVAAGRARHRRSHRGRDRDRLLGGQLRSSFARPGRPLATDRRRVDGEHRLRGDRSLALRPHADVRSSGYAPSRRAIRPTTRRDAIRNSVRTPRYTSLRDILVRPSLRSTKTMGTSRIRKPARWQW